MADNRLMRRGFNLPTVSNPMLNELSLLNPLRLANTVAQNFYDMPAQAVNSLLPIGQYDDGSYGLTTPQAWEEFAGAAERAGQGPGMQEPSDALTIGGSLGVGGLAEGVGSRAIVRGAERNALASDLAPIKKLQVGPSVVEYGHPTPGTDQIGWVYTPEHMRGQGHARAAMQDAARRADNEGKALELWIQPSKGVDEARLRRFYEDVGFRSDGKSRLMRREPNAADLFSSPKSAPLGLPSYPITEPVPEPTDNWNRFYDSIENQPPPMPLFEQFRHPPAPEDDRPNPNRIFFNRYGRAY